MPISDQELTEKYALDRLVFTPAGGEHSPGVNQSIGGLQVWKVRDPDGSGRIFYTIAHVRGHNWFKLDAVTAQCIIYDEARKFHHRRAISDGVLKAQARSQSKQ